MTTNGEDIPLYQSSEAPCKGDSVSSDSKPLKMLDISSSKEDRHAIKFSARKTEGDLCPYQPRPPAHSRRAKPVKRGSGVETVRNRRLRNSQESLTDPTCSSTDSLKEDQTCLAPGGLGLCDACQH